MGNKKAVGLLLDHMKKSTRSRSARTVTIHKPDQRVASFTLSYLDMFGYLTESLTGWKDVNLTDIVDAIKQFQGMFGLKKTGQVCVRTVRAMEQPRCGCPDVVRPRHQHYRNIRDFAAVQLPRWRKTGVIYRIKDYLPGMAKTDFESVIYDAFRQWTRWGNIEVNPSTSGPADIIISNGRGSQSNFDGPGGTLAWAYLPDGNDQQLIMKFDLDETWSLTPASRGILLQNVACHEFGHLMGLDHSRMQSALMAAYYNAALAVPQQQDDIPRFQARYGVRADGGNPTPPVGPTGRAQLTITGAFDGVTLDGRKIA